MKMLLVAIAIVGGISNNLCAEQHDSRVSVHEPMMVLVQRSRLPETCSTAVPVEACTATVGQILTCHCELREGSWQLAAAAQFIPVIYLPPDSFKWRSHEQLHIDDIEQSVGRHLTDLESLRFDTSGACEQKAAVARAEFKNAMEHFKDESNVLRHGESSRRLAQR